LNEELGNKKYDAEESKSWPKTITDSLLEKLKGKEFLSINKNFDIFSRVFATLVMNISS